MPDVHADVRSRALQRASRILGGATPLRAYLNVSAVCLSLWMSGGAAIPTEVFLKTVDLIVDREIQDCERPKSAPGAG
jgi:hypothetical protein